jgi:hypothetical protein
MMEPKSQAHKRLRLAGTKLRVDIQVRLLYLQYSSTLIGEGNTTHHVQVWVDGPGELINNVKSVTYYLGTKFEPPEITIYSKEYFTKFLHETMAKENFQLNATLRYKDGRTTELSKYIDMFSRAVIESCIRYLVTYYIG